MTIDGILDKLLFQIKGYNNTLRKSTQPFTLKRIKKHFTNYKINFDDEIIRETLSEYVGSLPIIATYIHPFLDHKVDLGKVLIMLAIHDIGELRTGD